LHLGAQKGANLTSCCQDTTKKTKKLPFDKQKAPLNALGSNRLSQSTENSKVPALFGHYFQFMEIYRMKKSLFAIAATTAVAGVAHAQSSVTVYGILDVGFSEKYTRTATTSSGGVNKTMASLFTSDAEQSSRLGFKGTEDLGGGSSAFFTIETGLTPAGSQMSTMNNRQSFVGYKKNGIGALSIGTQYTPIHNAFAATDPGQNNNTVGNVVRPSAGTEGSQQAASSAYTISTTNTLIANSDKISGFQFQALYAQNAQDATQRGNNTSSTTNGGNINWNGWGIGANYCFW
jgi:predicted porin